MKHLRHNKNFKSTAQTAPTPFGSGLVCNSKDSYWPVPHILPQDLAQNLSVCSKLCIRAPSLYKAHAPTLRLAILIMERKEKLEWRLYNFGDNRLSRSTQMFPQKRRKGKIEHFPFFSFIFVFKILYDETNWSYSPLNKYRDILSNLPSIVNIIIHHLCFWRNPSVQKLAVVWLSIILYFMFGFSKFYKKKQNNLSNFLCIFIIMKGRVSVSLFIIPNHEFI